MYVVQFEDGTFLVEQGLGWSTWTRDKTRAKVCVDIPIVKWPQAKVVKLVQVQDTSKSRV